MFISELEYKNLKEEVENLRSANESNIKQILVFNNVVHDITTIALEYNEQLSKIQDENAALKIKIIEMSKEQ